MGESLASNAALEVSVSFGRFEKDSLSWEKWSSFSPNKYLEEVEKCATPGSVAQKKAYFEAHYKKVAARKAELLNQEKQMENGSSGSDDSKCKDPGSEINERIFEIDGSKDENLGPVIEQVEDSVDEGGQSSLEEQIHDVVVAGEDQILPVEGVTEEPESSRSVHGLNSEKLEDDEFVKGVVQEVPIGSSEAKQLQQIVKNDTVKTEKVLQENVKLNLIRKPQKINPANKERNTAKTKRMPGSLVVKSSSQVSALRLSKPTSASAAKSAAKPLAKKETVPLLRKKNPLNVEIKKIPPKSLNMSISSDFTNFSRSDISTSRKSLIMERMGDKDIVKRAFKTFQGNLALSKSFCGERSSVPKPAPSLVTEARDSNSATERKGKEGRQTKVGSVGKRVPKILPSSFGLRSDGQLEKRKEFRKNLEEKSTVKEVEKKPLQSKPKEKREEEVKKSRQSLNFKATPLPAFYQGLTKSKSYLSKEGYKSETRG